MINYEMTDGDGNVIKTMSGTELRNQFGVAPNDPVFTEQLVKKFNLMRECADKPERIRATSPYTL